MPQKYKVVSNPTRPVGAHAFNGDRTQVAITPNDSTVEVLKVDGKTTTKLHTLKEHGQRVTAIDWAPTQNLIVTCAQDRNAYVWKFEAGVWSPTLVILRINRAATCVKWSPLENKFAVGSGSRLISVCYFEKENDWWVSNHIKKPIRSTILSLDWHPNNVLLAAGSSDFKARIFSAYIKSVDEKPAQTVWGKKMSFSNMMDEFGTGAAAGGWIHDVSFSASGDKLAYVAHDSSVTVIDGTAGKAVCRLITKNLPFTSLSWVTENSLVAAGHEYMPFLFVHEGATIKAMGKLDVPAKKASKAMSAMAKFQTLDRKGTTSESATATSVESTHQNAIVELSIHTGDKTKVAKFATVGLDGCMVVWDMAEAAGAVGGSIP